MLTMPKFAQLGPRGEVLALYCKVCGQKIAQSKGDDLIRSPIYQEAKLLCDDGSYHVTNGCVNCLQWDISSAVLTEMLQADQILEPSGYTDRDLHRSVVSMEVLGVGAL